MPKKRENILHTATDPYKKNCPCIFLPDHMRSRQQHLNYFCSSAFRANQKISIVGILIIYISSALLWYACICCACISPHSDARPRFSSAEMMKILTPGLSIGNFTYMRCWKNIKRFKRKGWTENYLREMNKYNINSVVTKRFIWKIYTHSIQKMGCTWKPIHGINIKLLSL